MPESETPKPATPPEVIPEDDEDALDGPGSADITGEHDVVDATGQKAVGSGSSFSSPKAGIKERLRHFNLYLVLFLFILVIAGVLISVAYFQSKTATTSSVLKAQTLTQQALQQVANSDATIGNTQQVLNVESSAVFAGKVLIRDGLEIAGNLQIGGTVALSNIAVSGPAAFGQVQINKNLAVAGDSALQGAVSIAKSLQVNGGGSFSGPVSAPQITTSGLQLNADLILTHHIITGGGTPNRSNGPALGSGGTASVSGSDTGGTITINTGSNTVAGCFTTISFTAKYNATPHVLLTPVGSSGGGLPYYVNRDTGSFSICVSSAAPSGSSFGFDYFVVD